MYSYLGSEPYHPYQSFWYRVEPVSRDPIEFQQILYVFFQGCYKSIFVMKIVPVGRNLCNNFLAVAEIAINLFTWSESDDSFNSPTASLAPARIWLRLVFILYLVWGKVIKGSSDQSHFIFEINVGKRRIRVGSSDVVRLWIQMNWSERKILQSVLSRYKYNSRAVLCRIRLFPTLILKIKYLSLRLLGLNKP